MKWREIWLIVPIVLLQALPNRVSAQSTLTPYFGEVLNKAGKPALFIRRTPVVVKVSGLDDHMQELVRDTIVLYAMANSVPVSGSNEGVNFFILSGKEIIKDGNLDFTELVKSGLPAELVPFMTQKSGWSSGCVPYVFPHAGSLAVAVGLIDASLEKEAQTACLSDILARGFGIGAGQKTTLPSKINTFKYAYVLSVIARCDKENASDSIDAVKSCIDRQSGPLILVGKSL